MSSDDSTEFTPEEEKIIALMAEVTGLPRSRVEGVFRAEKEINQILGGIDAKQTTTGQDPVD